MSKLIDIKYRIMQLDGGTFQIYVMRFYTVRGTGVDIPLECRLARTKQRLEVLIHTF